MKKIISIFLLCFVVSCTSSSDFIQGQGGKAVTFKGYRYNTLFDATIKSLETLKSDRSGDLGKGITIDYRNRNLGRIEASSGMGMLSYGEAIAVFITPSNDADQHRIEVHAKPVLTTTFTHTEWEDRIVNKIRETLPKK